MRGDPVPYRRRDGESAEDWQARLERDWPATFLTLRVIQMVDDNRDQRVQREHDEAVA